MSHDAVVELLRRALTPELYQDIRELWKAHSIAEDNRDIPGLMATLTEDCVYELPQSGHRWEGLDGAERFYRELLAAFPDIHFDLTDVVIGPQGVWERATATGTHTGDWHGHAATGEAARFTVMIYFPWDPSARRFKGEQVYVYGTTLFSSTHPTTDSETRP